MPPTEECSLGAANKAKIEGLKDEFTDFRKEVREDVDEIRKCMVQITNDFSHKPTWLITAALIGLTNLVNTLITWVITH